MLTAEDSGDRSLLRSLLYSDLAQHNYFEFRALIVSRNWLYYAFHAIIDGIYSR